MRAPIRFLTLAVLVALPAVLSAQVKEPPPKTGPGPKAPVAASATATTPAVPAAVTALVDINRATKDQLEAIPGIGKVYAAKIIAGRPYANKSQLAQKKVLPQGVYDKVKDRLIAKQ